MENHLKQRKARGSVLAAVLMCAIACGGGGGDGVIEPPPPPPPPPTGNVVGIVRNAADNVVIAGAVVGIGSVHVTTGADGSFTLNNVPIGLTVIRCTAPRLADYTSNIVVAAGTTTHDIRLAVQEVFEFFGGAFSLYVPASVTAVRGIVLALGPDTRPFADPRRSFNLGPNVPPELESELMVLGTNYRLLAVREGLAVLGYGNVVVAGGLDGAVWVALEQAAAVASRPDLAHAPLLIDAISSGTPAATQLTAQNPSRVAGLVLRVPVRVLDQLSPESGSVPTYLIIAELDEVVDNNVTVATYQQVRAAGGLWAVAEEPGKLHRTHSASRNELILEWFTTILPLRESTTPGGPLRAIMEESGWLGDPVTRVVSSWADFVGNKRAASWFPTQATATRWRGFTGTQ